MYHKLPQIQIATLHVSQIASNSDCSNFSRFSGLKLQFQYLDFFLETWLIQKSFTY